MSWDSCGAAALKWSFESRVIHIFVIPRRIPTQGVHGYRVMNTLEARTNQLYRNLGLEEDSMLSMATPNGRSELHVGKKIPPPVSPKPKRMTATKLVHHNPEPTKPTTTDRSTEDELDALTDLLVKNLEYSSDPDFFW